MSFSFPLSFFFSHYPYPCALHFGYVSRGKNSRNMTKVRNTARRHSEPPFHKCAHRFWRSLGPCLSIVDHEYRPFWWLCLSALLVRWVTLQQLATTGGHARWCARECIFCHLSRMAFFFWHSFSLPAAVFASVIALTHAWGVLERVCLDSTIKHDKTMLL